MNAVETKGLTKHFGPVQALSGLDLAVPAGTLYALLGSTELESPRRSKFCTGLLPPPEVRLGFWDMTWSGSGRR
ncbi:MAG: hypothetical protein ACLSHU_14880 [Oscillospiraceae bacterium]